ncbi:MAG TPA: DUF3613 domain-containing protein [Trinickia sp.]|nr:DUF3613 domain-containing protein [Trinickia sp.]
MKQASKIGAALRRVGVATCAIACMSALVRGEAQAGSPDTDASSRASAGVGSRHAALIGDATREWLDLQRTNAAAAPAMPMPGAQATLAYERYMNSFRTKIPASFGSAFSGEGGASRADATGAGALSTPPSGSN